MTDLEFKVYESLFMDTTNNWMNPTKMVYVETTPEKCLDRIRLRSNRLRIQGKHDRDGEQYISTENLYFIRTQHEYLFHKVNITPIRFDGMEEDNGKLKQRVADLMVLLTTPLPTITARINSTRSQRRYQPDPEESKESIQPQNIEESLLTPPRHPSSGIDPEQQDIGDNSPLPSTRNQVNITVVYDKYPPVILSINRDTITYQWLVNNTLQQFPAISSQWRLYFLSSLVPTPIYNIRTLSHILEQHRQTHRINLSLRALCNEVPLESPAPSLPSDHNDVAVDEGLETDDSTHQDAITVEGMAKFSLKENGDAIRSIDLNNGAGRVLICAQLKDPHILPWVLHKTSNFKITLQPIPNNQVIKQSTKLFPLSKDLTWKLKPSSTSCFKPSTSTQPTRWQTSSRHSQLARSERRKKNKSSSLPNAYSMTGSR
jgi:hypothetical protein